MNSLSNELKKNGFVIIKNFLDDEEINNIKKYISDTPNEKEYFEPFYKKTSPVRQYLDINIINNILNNTNFKNKSNHLLKKLINRDDMELKYSTILFKDKFYGSEEHWHQDGYYNNIIFENSEMNCYRFFIAIDKHTVKNACLNFIPKSKDLKLLEHHSIVNICGYEKGRISYEDLERESESNNIVPCELEPGDVIVFDNLVLHGSSSNQSSMSRKALQLQFISNKLKKRENNLINDVYIERNMFTLNHYKEKINYYEQKIENLQSNRIKLDSQLKLR